VTVYEDGRIRALLVGAAAGEIDVAAREGPVGVKTAACATGNAATPRAHAWGMAKLLNSNHGAPNFRLIIRRMYQYAVSEKQSSALPSLAEPNTRGAGMGTGRERCAWKSWGGSVGRERRGAPWSYSQGRADTVHPQY
jgi:hypothetical protein